MLKSLTFPLFIMICHGVFLFPDRETITLVEF